MPVNARPSDFRIVVSQTEKYLPVIDQVIDHRNLKSISPIWMVSNKREIIESNILATSVGPG